MLGAGLDRSDGGVMDQADKAVAENGNGSPRVLSTVLVQRLLNDLALLNGATGG